LDLKEQERLIQELYQKFLKGNHGKNRFFKKEGG
jgi:hypothetical protein